jgi:ABC-type multidrug transport system permease subunit
MLPVVAPQVGYALPSTYFLSLVRSSLSNSGTFIPDLVYMILSTAAFAAVTLFLFKLAEQRARNRGMIDRKAEY